MPQILIGTSGYDYPEWKGDFYPIDLKRKDFLSYYATQFNALELNNTFYNMPSYDKLLSFYERSNGNLNFSVKANRLLTHEISRSWENSAQEFKSAVMPLMNKGVLSSVLFQFPESFHYTYENRIYLSKILGEFSGFPSAVEFRHREWIRESVFEGLNKRGAGLVFCDMPQLKNLPDGTRLNTPFIGKNAYIRLHGRNAESWYAHVPKAQTSITSSHANGAKATYAAGDSSNGSARYSYDYNDEELNLFVPIIKKAFAEGKKTQVYFNNHPNGSGARNARKLRKMISEAGCN